MTATRDSGFRMLPAGTIVLRSLLLAVLCLSLAGPTPADTFYGLTGPLRQIGSLSGLELGRLSSAGLKISDQRIGRLRASVDASRAARAAFSSLGSDDRFALGKKIADPVTLRTPPKMLHELTIGRISDKAFNKYATFEEFWQASGTGTRGKFFESQSVIQANAKLKKQGSGYRFAVTAVEGDPANAADAVLLDPQGEIVARYQLKSTRNTDDIIGFALDPKYADTIIVTHPETLAELKERLAREVEKAARRGKPLPPKWQTVQDQLESGKITDSLVDGEPVDSHTATSTNAEKFQRRQWKTKGSSGAGAGKSASKATQKSGFVAKTLAKTGVVVGRVVKGTLVVLEVVAAPVDLGFAAYGYYDTFSRYNRGGLDQDIFATKLVIHTTEAALGGAAVYSLGVGMGLIAAPEPVVSKVIGIVVVAGSVVVIAADMAVSNVIADRDQARQQTLEALTSNERRLEIHADLLERLKAVSGN